MHRLLSTAIATLAALVLASAVGAARFSATPQLPPGWSHAEINVTVRGVPHTLVYDRGRVQAVTATSLTLRERDGSSQVVNVSPNARVTIDRQPASLSQVRRFEIAITLRIDGADATRVTVRVPPAVAAQAGATTAGVQTTTSGQRP